MAVSMTINTSMKKCDEVLFFKSFFATFPPADDADNADQESDLSVLIRLLIHVMSFSNLVSGFAARCAEKLRFSAARSTLFAAPPPARRRSRQEFIVVDGAA